MISGGLGDSMGAKNRYGAFSELHIYAIMSAKIIQGSPKGVLDKFIFGQRFRLGFDLLERNCFLCYHPL